MNLWRTKTIEQSVVTPTSPPISCDPAAGRSGRSDRPLSGAMTRRGFAPTHERGRVLVNVAVLVAGGGEAIADIDVQRVDQVHFRLPNFVKRIEKARAKVRAHVWSQLPGGVPASRVADSSIPPATWAYLTSLEWIPAKRTSRSFPAEPVRGVSDRSTG